MFFEKLSMKKLIFLIAGVIALLGISQLTPPGALADAAIAAGSDGRTAMRILSITVFAICWWAGEVFTDWQTAIAMVLLWILIGGVKFQEAFSAFSGTSLWLIVGAFCLAAGITKTGFFSRISWFLIRMFSPTFRGQVLALLIVGTICVPLVPSATAKAVLGGMIAKNLADAMGYEQNSKGRVGLFIASFIGFSATTPAFMSGSAFTYTLLGVLPENVKGNMTWGSWFLAGLPWLLLVVIGMYVCILRAFSPNEKSGLTKEYVEEEYRKLGSMNGKEKISAALLVLAFTLWILESVVGINAAVTAMLVTFLCFALKILEPKEIATAVPWGLVIFLGGVLNLGNILSRVGIDRWLQGMLTPVFLGMKNKVLMIVAIIALVLLLRLFIVSQAAVVILVMAILAPATSAMGIHPFIIGFCTLAAEQCWFMAYQNVVFVPALSCMQNTVEYRKTVLPCVLFQIVSLLACLLCIPYWGILGYL